MATARWASRLAWSTNAWLVSGVAATTFVASVIIVAQAWVARGLINAVVALLDAGVDSFRFVLPWLASAWALTLVQAVSNLAKTLFRQRLFDELDLRLTSDVLAHAATLDLAYFEDPRFQDVMERALKNTSRHFSQFADNAQQAITDGIQAISLMVILIAIEPVIGLILIPLVLPYGIFQWRLSKLRYAQQHARATRRRWIRYFTSQLTNRRSVPEIKLLDLAPFLLDQFRSLTIEFNIENLKVYMRRFTGTLIFVIASLTAIYAVLARVVTRVLMGALTVGDMTIFATSAVRLRRTLENTVVSASSAMEQTLFISNLIEFLDTRPHFEPDSGLTPRSSLGEVEFESVSFSYSGTAEPVISELTLHIRPGETVALVGENGAGKTTLVKLIARFYDPDSGCILLDGNDLKDLSLAYLQGQLSFVFQDFNRYEATAGDNIAYGDWHRLQHDKERIAEIARLADVDSMIEAMPQKYDTLLGRMFGEFDLSGGQWQKIAVARAFARNSSLLILDEPTSNLDARAEYRLFSRFRELARGRTTILISHRFSTVSMADRILVMEKGQIIESGTHEELLARAGHYASLYNLQHMQMTSSWKD